MSNQNDMSDYTAESPAREAWRMFRRNIPALVGVFILAVIILLTLYGQLFYTGDAFDVVWAPHERPGVTPEFPLGTDYLGRDLVAGLLTGGGATLAVGATAAMITMIIGITFGALAGFYGGWVDNLLMRITEFFQVLPALLFAMVLVTLFSPSLFTIAMAIGVVSWPQTARLTRAEFLKIKELEYVTAARAIGAKNKRIIWKVILPNAMPPLIVSATLTIGVAILFEAGLSFLGLGDPNVMSWGLMIGANREYILDAWWPVTFPGLAIFFTVFAVSLIGDGLNDAFNPKLRER
ncbi:MULTISPECIES: ABC transporter permease [Lentibacter]|jgi:peptide/nickel transport system permease protein|uniref:Peptide/nickel transport system permease protein n=4 Tax=Lentibacter algarum TaxID=576131 RepID=A0A1H3LWR4_9RHOB|nr:ABC transporter permease [Lentibacter algarum]MCO4776831.1 ABC transporter permease [Lentibacter algarum]MCO4826739.1 ABC transporter permease [Lentibacter algarum]WIF32739.1 dipeptide transport system permease protein DppC [Lentibacter algarum]SDY68235.1 peptide/nickel transport system permease protein [Lentibacter algarum]